MGESDEGIYVLANLTRLRNNLILSATQPNRRGRGGAKGAEAETYNFSIFCALGASAPSAVIQKSLTVSLFVLR
jgi:hypothetical protein